MPVTRIVVLPLIAVVTRPPYFSTMLLNCSLEKFSKSPVGTIVSSSKQPRRARTIRPEVKPGGGPIGFVVELDSFQFFYKIQKRLIKQKKMKN